MRSRIVLSVGSALMMAICGLSLPAKAEEKNGLSVTVTKKTLERNDVRSPYYYSSDRIDRTQALKVTIINKGFKETPAGEVDWTLLVRKYNSTAIEGYKGKEALKVLKPAETVELVIGAAAIQGFADVAGQAKDKMEHQIIVTQGGKETMRLTTNTGFDALAKRATYSAAK